MHWLFITYKPIFLLFPGLAQNARTDIPAAAMKQRGRERQRTPRVYRRQYMHMAENNEQR